MENKGIEITPPETSTISTLDYSPERSSRIIIEVLLSIIGLTKIMLYDKKDNNG